MNIDKLKALMIAAALATAACGDSTDDGDGDTEPTAVPQTYSFDSRFEPGTSSVSYSGQIARQVPASAVVLSWS